MIRINLGRTRIEEMEALDSALPGVSSGTDTSGAAVIGLKILCLIGGVVAFNYFENQNLDRLNAELAAVNQQRSQLQQTLITKQEEFRSLDTADQESKALQDKMALLKSLSQMRLREVKSLDYIQTIVPARLWITRLSIEKERYIIRGRSHDESAVSMFMNRLEDGGYFSDVVLTQDTNVSSGQGQVREFEIVARSEVIN